MSIVHVSVVSDVVCPWCFIGKRRLERAMASRPALAFEVRWLPYELHPQLPRAGMPRQELIDRKFGGAVRARSVFARVAAAGAEDGIAFDFDGMSRIPNTLAAHSALLWASQIGVTEQNALAEALFRAFFEQAQDIGDAGVVARLCAGIGMDGADVEKKLAGDVDREVVRLEAEHHRARGVMGVPHFVVEDRYAIPGAQLPETMLHVIDAAHSAALAHSAG